jgi:spindle assembly abnormal protein 6
MSTSVELFRDKPLFEASLDVVIQAAVHTDAKTTPLSFRIIEGTRQQQTSNQHEKIFHFELTDPSEPFFLFVLDIGEFDFHNLKRDQSIIVDFLAFPAKLVTLLKTCMTCTDSEKRQRQQSSTFSTSLDATNGLFSVVESNEFKNLTHISLQLRPANDTALKGYLAARLSMAIEDADSLRTQLFTAGAASDDASESISQLNAALGDMRSRLDHEVITLKAAHANDVSGLKVAYADALNQAKSEAERGLTTLRAQSEGTIEDLRGSLTALQEQHSVSEKNRSSAEYRCRELERDLGMVSAERDRAEASSKQYSAALGERDAGILRLEREAAGLQSKVNLIYNYILFILLLFDPFRSNSV